MNATTMKEALLEAGRYEARGALRGRHWEGHGRPLGKDSVEISTSGQNRNERHKRQNAIVEYLIYGGSCLGMIRCGVSVK